MSDLIPPDRKTPWLGLACGSAALLMMTGLAASTAPLSVDELVTAHLVRLPTLERLWAALCDGPDPSPPLYHLAARAGVWVLGGESPLALRLPSVLGFWAACLATFAAVTRRAPLWAGTAAALFLTLTFGYPLSYFARSYGFALGLAALAFLAWQARGDGSRWAFVGLFVALAAAISSHYYAVLLLIPLGLGELARTWLRRRVDLPTWLALVGSLAPLLAFGPLIRNARTFREGSWLRPEWGEIPYSYERLLPHLAIPTLVVLIGLAARKDRERPESSDPGASVPVDEVIAASGLALLPVWAMLLGLLATGAYTTRYALPAVLGFALLLGFGLGRLGPRIGAAWARTLSLGFVALTLWFFLEGLGLIPLPGSGPRRDDGSAASLPTALAAAGDSGTDPIVVPEINTIFPLEDQGPPELARRLTYLLDPREDRSQIMRKFRPWCELAVEEIEPFLARHRTFWVHATPKDVLLDSLAAKGIRLRYAGRVGETILFAAERDPRPNP